MKQAAVNTCPLATGQPREATSIQQPAGRGGFARILSSTEDSPGLGRGVWEGRAWAVSAHMPRSVQCPEFGGRKVKSGLCSGAMLFLYKATQGDVSLDTVGAKSRKKISLITAPRVVLFFPTESSLHAQSWCSVPYGASWPAQLLDRQFSTSLLLGTPLTEPLTTTGPLH